MKKLLIIIGVILVVLLAAAAGTAYYVATNLEAVGAGEAQTIDIKKGSSVQDVAKQLKEAGLIKNETVFVGFFRFTGIAASIQSGIYKITPQMSVKDIAEALKSGKVQEIWVTIPEGWNAKQIAAELESKGLVKAKDFLAEIKKNDFTFGFLADKPKNTNLEGFLFPDTYRFKTTTTARDIITKMLTNFDERYNQSLRTATAKMGWSIYEVVTLASIIEREVTSSADMSVVSGIFHGRLFDNYPLESCATVQYVLNTTKTILSYEDTRTNSPYNTYIHTGLPVGPISNPGLEAIRAAIYPADTDYRYFLSTKDGKTIYSKTYSEHLANQAKYLK